jgi:hypothetical protein
MAGVRDSWEATEVTRLRGRGVPWAHIAAQLGRSEIDLRQTYAPAPEPVVPEPSPGPRRSASPSFKPTLSERLLLALANEGRPASGVYLRGALGMGNHSDPVASFYRVAERARREGLVERSGNSQNTRYTLTAAGRNTAAAIKGRLPR